MFMFTKNKRFKSVQHKFSVVVGIGQNQTSDRGNEKSGSFIPR